MAWADRIDQSEPAGVVGGQTTDAVVTRIGDIEGVGAGEEKPAGASEFGDIAGGAITAKAKAVDASDGGDIAGGVYAADSVIEPVGNIERSE